MVIMVTVVKDRDDIIEDIFRTGFNSQDQLSLPQEYKVIKVRILIFFSIFFSIFFLFFSIFCFFFYFPFYFLHYYFLKISQKFLLYFAKVNRAGKHQERLFKLTIDSLLNINDSKILNEISFSGIETVSQDQANSDVIWLKYKVCC